MKFTKWYVFIAVMAFLSLSCEKDKETSETFSSTGLKNFEVACFPYTTDLLAGQSMDVGDVTAVIDGSILTVTYEIIDNCWCMTESHLDVQLDPANFPMTPKGNPKVGHFAYSGTFSCGDFWEVQIDLNSMGWNSGDPVYIAAHAVVKHPELTSFANALPIEECIMVQYPTNGGTSYYQTTIYGSTFLAGTHEGWCIDTDHMIPQNTNFNVNVFSTYEPLEPFIVEFPENLDMVNWIANQGFTGQTSQCGGVFTYGDVQRAIWTLVEDNLSTAGIGSWSQCRVDEIVQLANLYGDGYVPDCTDLIGVVLQPVNPANYTCAQTTIAMVPYERFEFESAWADGTNFPGNNWSMYFSYQCNP